VERHVVPDPDRLEPERLGAGGDRAEQLGTVRDLDADPTDIRRPSRPARRSGSPREGVADAAVDGQRVQPVVLAARSGGQEQHGLGGVLREDGDAEEVALPVELLDLLDGDALRAPARGAPRETRGPSPGRRRPGSRC
jgi:hypothetical protein